jgi:sporulation protein YlmC with PRC-barrel domain
MRNIPLDTVVRCTDGPAGKSSAVIIDPLQQRVTHLVVKRDKRPLSRGRLVPVERIKETTPDLIRLDCTTGDVAAMEPFIGKRYIQKEPRQYPTSFYGGEGAAYLKAYVFAAEVMPVEVERVPPGELAVHRGDNVQATDGSVGEVDELLVDPASQQITHLVLQKGFLWGQQEVAVPISAIERVAKNTVYLNIDRQAVQGLPAIPVNRDFEWEEPDKAE